MADTLSYPSSPCATTVLVTTPPVLTPAKSPASVDRKREDSSSSNANNASEPYISLEFAESTTPALLTPPPDSVDHIHTTSNDPDSNDDHDHDNYNDDLLLEPNFITSSKSTTDLLLSDNGSNPTSCCCSTSSLTSLTSTTSHQAQPEWASPDLSFRSYLDLISTTEKQKQHEHKQRTKSQALPSHSPPLMLSPAPTKRIQAVTPPIWAKRSLSMSTIGGLDHQRPNASLPRAVKPSTRGNSGMLPLNPKRLRQDKTPTKENTPTHTTLPTVEEPSSRDYFTPKRHASSVESIYVSFPSIDDHDEDEQDTEKPSKGK